MRIPYVLELPGHPLAQNVHGEIYSITKEDAASLDHFEGVLIDFYYRGEVELVITANEGKRTSHPDPVSGQVLMAGSIIRAETYFRGKGGPSWAQKWSVERLQTLPMKSMYTREDAEGYIPQAERLQK